MRFCKFLRIMNCYIGQEKSQNDFMYFLFSMIVCEPFSEEDRKKEEEDNYYPFSKLYEKSNAKKIYNGERSISKTMARFMHSHFDSACLINLIEDMSDEEKKNLCEDLKIDGVTCNIDDVADVVSNLFECFILAALDENDTIDTQIKAESTTRVETREATNKDVLLLEETSNSCPICGHKLLQSKKNNVIKKYKVVQIFPKNLNREDYYTFSMVFSANGNYENVDNLIILCSDCAIDYESEQSFDRFKELVELKKSLSQKIKLQQKLEDIDIEDDISTVISALVNTSSEDIFVDLSLQALRVEQKIDGKYGILIHSISTDVVHYYKFIEEQFQIADSYNTNSFERIAGEVRLAYEKLEGNGLNPNDIYENLIEWMMLKLKFEDRHRQAVSIVISFFVQNCEVFREITK